jgi:RNA polymerase sigma-70 factor, ECF subfamily
MKYIIPITDEDERECIKKAKARDKHSFCRLIEKYNRKVKGYCIGRLKCNFDSAEDIMQEAFCKAWQSIGSFEGTASFSTWLCTIAHNHYINTCKDCDNKAETLDDTRVASGGLHAEDFATQDCVQRQLEKVRPEYRDIIDFVHLQDMSQKTVAELLGVPLGTVKSRLNRALKEAGPLLRECL